MENIYKIRSSNLINIKEEFDKISSNLVPSSVLKLPETEEDIKKLVNFGGTDDDFKALNDSISIDNLTQPDEVPITDFQIYQIHKKRNMVAIPEKALELNCIKSLFDSQDDTSKTTKPKAKNKYNKYKFIKVDVDNLSGVCDLKPLKDILIVIRVYEPFIYNRGETSGRKPRLSQEFAVIGSQYLTELRDKIYCQCRFGPFYDLSNDYDAIVNMDTDNQTTEDVDNPGFFFITDTFYNDTRQTDIDYTTEIREWIKRQPDIGEAKVKAMQETRFDELTVRMGFPHVYKHYGNCEHLLVFYDMRLLTSDDSLHRSDYPMLRMVSSTRSNICMVCGTMEACFVVTNSITHIHEKTFLCKTCFILYHYVDGKKIGDFQAYRYHGNLPTPI